jgi:hypothetical protein
MLVADKLELCRVSNDVGGTDDYSMPDEHALESDSPKDQDTGLRNGPERTRCPDSFQPSRTAELAGRAGRACGL